MNNKKIKIIDKTLVALYDIYGNKLVKYRNELRELCNYLNFVGGDYIEVTPRILDILLPLPQGVEYILNVENKLEVNKYKNINFIIFNLNNIPSYILETVNFMLEIDINNVNDIQLLANFKLGLKANNFIRITGLDDLMMYDYKKIFYKLKKIWGDNINLNPKNNYGCATAIAIEWIKNIGTSVTTSFGGIGGYCALEEFIATKNFILKLDNNEDLSLLPKIVEIIEKITNNITPTNKPIIGRNIFQFESGIHADGIFKNPDIYEPYDPSKVGIKRKLIIGKHSGTMAIKRKLRELSIPIEEDKLIIILDKVRELSTIKERGLTDKEIIKICTDIGVIS